MAAFTSLTMTESDEDVEIRKDSRGCYQVYFRGSDYHIDALVYLSDHNLSKLADAIISMRISEQVEGEVERAALSQ